MEFWKGSPYFPVGTFPVEVHVPFTSFHKESPVSGHSGRYLCHHLKCWWLEFKRMELVSNGTSFSSMDLLMEVSESSWQMENTLFHLLVPLRNHVTLLLSHKSSRLLRRMQRWRVSWILKVWFESFFFSTYAHGLRLLERDAAYFRLALLSTRKEIGIKRFYYVLLGRNFKRQPRYLASLTRALSLPLPLSVIKVPITTNRTQLQPLFPTFFRY